MAAKLIFNIYFFNRLVFVAQGDFCVSISISFNAILLNFIFLHTLHTSRVQRVQPKCQNLDVERFMLHTLHGRMAKIGLFCDFF